jgi:hypothetical protein
MGRRYRHWIRGLAAVVAALAGSGCFLYFGFRLWTPLIPELPTVTELGQLVLFGLAGVVFGVIGGLLAPDDKVAQLIVGGFAAFYSLLNPRGYSEGTFFPVIPVFVATTFAWSAHFGQFIVRAHQPSVSAVSRLPGQ